MPEGLMLFPFGGNAKEALIAVFNQNQKHHQWDVIGFLDDDPRQWGRECCGRKVLGGTDMLSRFPRCRVLAVPGNPADFRARHATIDRLPISKDRFATIIDPSAILSTDSTIGYNTLIMANVFIGCGVKIGNHCVVLPNTAISHESCIGDYCCIGANVTVSGSVRIGASCYIGSGTHIREKIKIGEKAMTGLGSAVIADVDARSTVAGNPAKLMRRKDSSVD